MSATGALTLGKEERLCSRKLIERLFNGGDSLSATAYPLKVVYLSVARAAGEPRAQILVSVPKRCFKRAVKRNRVKRQVREAYRKNKRLLCVSSETPSESAEVLSEQAATRSDEKLLIAFIWLDTRLHSSVTVERKVSRLLEIIGGKE